MLDIDATIFCEKETHKRIIIGKNGSMLKKISTFARQDIERFFDCKVFLQTWVKVKEDWRNREKWDLYETAVNEMLKKTNTTYAPWHVLESNDKKYARIKALKIVIDAIEAALDNKTNKK